MGIFVWIALKSLRKNTRIYKANISRGNNQVIAFAKGESGELDSLYIRIRNSFAHGNYFKKKEHYYLWNEVVGKESKLASLMILTFKSLEQIHSILKEFELK